MNRVGIIMVETLKDRAMDTKRVRDSIRHGST